MKKNVLIFGLISGLIITGMMLYTTALCYNNPEKFESNEVLGYISIIVAFSLIFVGIKNFRDKQNGGLISFGKAFRAGLYMSLISSTLYVAVWLVDYYVFIPDFMEQYSAHVMNDLKESGASIDEIESKQEEMETYKEWYKNPLFVILLTYMEVLPIGIVISLLSALILKRKHLKTEEIIT